MEGTMTNAQPAVARPGLWTLLREDVDCVFHRDPAARSRFEVVTTYPGVHAILLQRVAHRLWSVGLRYPARFISWFARLVTNIDIHPGATLGRRFFIDHGAGVVIGETAEIGDDVTLYHGVTLGGTTWNKGKRHPTLGNGVVIGAGAKILGAITLGERVRVGANSVVVKDVPAHRTVVGIPGKVVTRLEAVDDNSLGLNLDHHLIPDPVGKAIACLMERIEVLERTLQQQGEPVEGQCQGPIPTGFMPLGDPIWDAAQGAVRRHWSFQGDEPQRRDAPKSGRPFGLAAVTASAALQSLPMEQPLAALRALHPSVTATNEEHESCRDRPSCEADDLCGTQVAHALRKM
jgi:serine O-acetyltransferase